MRYTYLIWVSLMVLYSLVYYSNARGDDWIIRGGPAIIDGSPSGTSKIFGVRTDSTLILGAYSSNEFGFWVDNRPGMNTSAFIKSQVGIQPGNTEGLFGKVFIGPAIITSTDAALGGHIQFSEDIGLGVRDKDTMMSITYSHFSSAGLSSPNHGKDFLTFELGFIW